jgi:hypothetical protein
MKKQLMTIVLISTAFMGFSLALAQQFTSQEEYERFLTNTAAERCSSENIKGENQEITVFADGNIMVRFLRMIGLTGSIGSSVIYTKTQWDGRQRVITNDQLDANRLFVECKKTELRILEERYPFPLSGSNLNRDLKIASCVDTKIKGYGSIRQMSINGGAKTGSKSPFRRVPRHTVPVCLSVGPNQIITAAEPPVNTCCHGQRCSVTEVRYSNENKTACIETTAWSEDQAYGGGGCAKYTLIINYRDMVDDTLIAGYYNECSLQSQ